MAQGYGVSIGDTAVVITVLGAIAAVIYVINNNPITRAADAAVQGISGAIGGGYEAIKSAIGGASNLASNVADTIGSSLSDFAQRTSLLSTSSSLTSSGSLSANLQPQNLAANNNLSVFAKVADQSLYLSPLPASILQNPNTGVLNLQTGQVTHTGISPIGNPGSIYSNPTTGVLNLQTGKVTPIQQKTQGVVLSSISNINADLGKYTIKKL